MQKVLTSIPSREIEDPLLYARFLVDYYTGLKKRRERKGAEGENERTVTVDIDERIQPYVNIDTLVPIELEALKAITTLAEKNQRKAKMMSLDETIHRALDEAETYGYIETESDKQVHLAIFGGCPGQLSIGANIKLNLYPNEYNKEWRAWTEFPTEEERRLVPWLKGLRTDFFERQAET